MPNTSDDDYKKRLKEYYDRQAPVYRATYTGEGRYPTAHHRMQICLALIDQLATKPKTVVDAGCGDARMVVALNKKGIPCTGFDLSDGLLDLGRKHLQESGLPENLIASGDIYEIPRPDKSCDLLMSLGVLENLDRHADLFKEFRRVLQPGGRILISVDNHLFSLFTFNKHTLRFLMSIFEDIQVPAEIREDVIRSIGSWLNLDDVKQIDRVIEDRQIPKEGVAIPVYHRLNIDEEMRKFGFRTERLRFYHVHPIPPRFEVKYPDLFRGFAEKLETSDYSWKNTLLCNCMIVQAALE